LGLQDNQISTIPVGFFDAFPDLEYLDMTNNLLSSLPERLFDGMTLDEVNFEANTISSIGANTFQGANINGINLNGNRISSLEP
jgi:Leucine-rich repeat (LRR) protein